MPYIEKDLRASALVDPTTVGELTYALTQLVVDYTASTSFRTFARYSEVIAALECAKLEYYRRVVAPYEDAKCEQNGDVYPR